MVEMTEGYGSCDPSTEKALPLWRPEQKYIPGINILKKVFLSNATVLPEHGLWS